MKIPTLLGIAFIIAIIAIGGLFLYYQQKTKPEEKSFLVSDLQVVNISDTGATVVWETDRPSVGLVTYSESDNLDQTASDNRDRGQAKPRQVHFVTLKNLKPNTRYAYKIKNENVSYPEKISEFKTANVNLTKEDSLNFSFIKPIKGTILNTNLNSIDESLIYLNIPGAQPLATFSSTAGNFIMPLKLVLNESLDQVFTIAQDTPATLIIKKGDLKSEVKILISDTTVNLPPIPINNNLDLVNFKMQPINVITFKSSNQSNLDFNGDNRVNSLDLATLREAVSQQSGTSADREKFDINSDGIIDQKDVDAFSKSLSGN